MNVICNNIYMLAENINAILAGCNTDINPHDDSWFILVFTFCVSIIYILP